MGMSTHVIGLISDKDPLYQKHAKVLRACLDADIEKLPKETAKYFGSDEPYESLFDEKRTVKIPKKEYCEDMIEGYDIEVSKIPEGVTTIRFYNSY